MQNCEKGSHLKVESVMQYTLCERSNASLQSGDEDELMCVQMFLPNASPSMCKCVYVVSLFSSLNLYLLI